LHAVTGEGGTVRFGLFYEHQLPRPWRPGDGEQLLGDALEQIELADRLALDCVWLVEHHFLEEYSHSSAPEVFLGAASQRTQQIRLGHGIVQLPVEVNHPARVAERVATLDLLSHGRLELGTGEGSSQAELGGFGVPRGAKRDQWEEALDVVCRMLVEEPFTGHRGRWIDVPPRNVVPKPRQTPHPPLWVACSRRETIELAGRRGLGVLSFSFIAPEDAKPWVDMYYELLGSSECVPAGLAVNPNFAVVVPFMCHPDEETAIERGIDGAHFFGYSLAHYYVFGRHRPANTSVWDEFERYRHERGFARDIIRADRQPLDIKVLQGALGSLRGAVGTPEQIADLCARYEAAGVDQVIFVAQAGRNRHEHICEALELFGKQVLPSFADDRDAKETAKHDRMAEAIERAMDRRPCPPPRDVKNYVIATTGELTPARTPHYGQKVPRAQPFDVRRNIQRGMRRLIGSLVGRVPEPVVRRVGDTSAALVAYRWGMEQTLRGAKLEGVDAVIRMEVTDDDRVAAWELIVRDGIATTSAANGSEPHAVVRVDVVDWLALVSGKTSGGELLFDGRLSIEGDESKVVSLLGQLDGEHQPF
jgi:alkanesulfonate monooxygenase SsuD/methylene tetrahydromethanopterin reductase-like flavin-dependent oxidoreductase (luciferase family)/predicted lipid carrier protein YhbT